MTRTKWILKACFAALAVISVNSAVFGVDSPHSRSSLGSIFESFQGPGGANPAGLGEAAPANKPISRERLVELLDEAGLEASLEGEDAAKLDLKQGRFTFPILVSLDADRERVRLDLQLTDLNGKPAPAVDKLMGLLAANADFQPAFFSFSAKRKRIELVGSVPNLQVSGETLRDEMSKLAAIAESTASLWESAATPGSAPAGSAPAAAAPAQNNVAVRPAQSPAAPAASSGLIGKWSAAKAQNQAFAMQLNNDGTFVLVFVNAGKQSRSTGKFAVGGNQLTLTTSDGTKFSGQLTNLTGRSFDFTPQGGQSTKLTFRKAS